MTEILNESPSDLIPRGRVTGAVVAMDSNHAQIHAGNAFSLVGTMDVAQSQSGIVQIAVPAAAYVHFQAAQIDCDAGPAIVSLLEDYTLTSEVGAATLVPANHHRIINEASVLTVKALADAAATAGSAPITLATIPLHGTTQGQAKISADTSNSQEWVLAPGSTYLVTFGHSVSGSVKFGYNLFWYEESGA